MNASISLHAINSRAFAQSIARSSGVEGFARRSASVRNHRRRGWTLIEILIVVAILAILVTLFFSARPMRVAQRIELASGHKQLEDLRLTGSTYSERWDFLIPHCERLVLFCKTDPAFRSVAAADGTRGDPAVPSLEACLAGRAAALAATPPKWNHGFDSRIEALRCELEARYLNLYPSVVGNRNDSLTPSAVHVTPRLASPPTKLPSSSAGSGAARTTS